MGGKETVASKKATTYKLEQKISMKTSLEKQQEAAGCSISKAQNRIQQQETTKQSRGKILREQQRKEGSEEEP
jgi:hypothetical protein